MQGLPVISKLNNLQSLDKAFDFSIELKFCKSDFYFLNRSKNVRWPLIASFQFMGKLFNAVYTEHNF